MNKISKILNRNFHGDNVEVLKSFPDECIDLTVTSPPYDHVRSYKGVVNADSDFNGHSFNFEALADSLYRVTKPGGVVVWVVNDQTIKGDRTLSSHEQAQYFHKIGFLCHDINYYNKPGCPFPPQNRYVQDTELIYIFSKDRPPKYANILRDKPNRYAGHLPWGQRSHYSPSDELVPSKSLDPKRAIAPCGIRSSVHRINVGARKMTKDDCGNHPAIFPEELAWIYIHTYSNEGDIVLDPFCGSGTVPKIAKQFKRAWTGIEINTEYCDIIQRRVNSPHPFVIKPPGEIPVVTRAADNDSDESIGSKLRQIAIYQLANDVEQAFGYDNCSVSVKKVETDTTHLKDLIEELWSVNNAEVVNRVNSIVSVGSLLRNNYPEYFMVIVHNGHPVYEIEVKIHAHVVERLNLDGIRLEIGWVEKLYEAQQDVA